VATERAASPGGGPLLFFLILIRAAQLREFLATMSAAIPSFKDVLMYLDKGLDRCKEVFLGASPPLLPPPLLNAFSFCPKRELPVRLSVWGGTMMCSRPFFWRSPDRKINDSRPAGPLFEPIDFAPHPKSSNGRSLTLNQCGFRLLHSP